MDPLRKTLLQCGEFQNPYQLRAILSAEELVIWQDRLPTGFSSSEQVDLTISFLVKKYTEHDENALVVLLRVLAERRDPKDSLHHQLLTLAEQLARYGQVG